MRFRDLTICIVCVAVAVFLLIAAAGRQDDIHSMRKEMGLISNEPLENAPPSLAFATVAMGAFRGLIVDILWMRADKLKEEGQFFDAKQLAEWITILQPRFATVWDFHAWNMAYNISVAIPQKQWAQRWQWVRNGYELLRDNGIEKNPRSILLYWSIAWIFQHKIGGHTDECHKHYKREFALEVRSILGERRTHEWFDSLADAPLQLQQVIKNGGVGEFVSALKSADKAFDDDDTFTANYLALRANPDKFSKEAFAVIDRFRAGEALEKFDVFARAFQLRNVLKLDPERMIRLNKKYGPSGFDDPNATKPLNWEHAQVHAMYWAELGLEKAGKKEEYSVNEKNADRIVYHSLQGLYRSGKMIIYPIPGELPSVFLRPDLDMFDTCNRGWTEKIKKYEAFERGNPKAVRIGRKNFLVNALLSFYQMGRKGKATQIYTQLRKEYPREEFDVPLITFVKKRLAHKLQTMEIVGARELILISLQEAYFRYAIHDDDEAAGLESWAKMVYDLYQREWLEVDDRRLDMPSFAMLRYLALSDFISNTFYPEYMRQSLLNRIKIEKPELLDKLRKQEEFIIEKRKDKDNI
jgi:hypothetical protein